MSQDQATGEAAEGTAKRDVWHQLGHASWLAAALALGSFLATSWARSSNPNAEYLAGGVSVAFVAAGLVFGLTAVLGTSRHRRRGPWVAGAAGVALNLGLVGTDVALNPNRHVYLGPSGWPQVVRVRDPEPGPAVAGVLIYLHGAGGTEREGLDTQIGRGTFARLHTELDRRGWALVCPRYPEFEGLRAELRRRYGGAPLYLAGASMGGRHAYLEAAENPAAYRGVVLLCPALEQNPTAGPLPPTWVVCGSDDGISTGPSRLLAGLHHDDPRFRYREIPDGDHGAPLAQADWAAAFAFFDDAP